MEPWVIAIFTIFGSVAASGGFWSYLQSKRDKNDWKTKMLIGLGHDRITYLGMTYIDRKKITQDEYENLHDYLYLPYKGLGGNGSADRIMGEVEKLQIVKSVIKEEN